MDQKELRTNQQVRKNKFDEQLRQDVKDQLGKNNQELTKNNQRKKIKSLQDVHRRDFSGNKNLANFQGNNNKHNLWGNDRAINKVLKRKEKQTMNQDL